MLLEIFEDRKGKRSTIIKSKLYVNKWNDVIGETKIGDEVLDRLVHS